MPSTSPNSAAPRPVSERHAHGHMAWSAGPGTALGAGPRAALLFASTLLLWASNPGVLFEGPIRALVGIIGLMLWVLAACRTGPWRKTLEWLAGGTFGVLVMCWVWYITPPSLGWIFAGWGLYVVLAGWFLRRLLHHIGLPLAVALSFTAIEALRTLIPTPFGISWIRMGHLFAETPGLRGAAAYIGVDGLSFLAGALAGLGAIVLLRSRRLYKGGAEVRLRAQLLGRRTAVQVAWVLGLAGVCAWLGDRTAYVESFEPGPRVVLVQPGFEQERKRELYDGADLMQELFDEQLALSLRAVADERAAGRDVDLVAWGETMFAATLVGEGLRGSDLATWQTLAWPVWTLPLESVPDLFINSPLNERGLLQRLFAGALYDFGRASVAAIWAGAEPPLDALEGTHFLSGAASFDRVPGTDTVRRTNGIALWNDAGERLGESWKWHLVPGAENIWGLEVYGWARAWAGALMPYMPDFQPERRVRLLELPGGAGDRAWRIGGAVCFDNGFDDLFLEHAAAGADFELVVSNEAWYRESVEFDQMIAMTRLWSIESGRAVVRAANSGISGVWLPDGSELVRLVEGGRDRAVQGTLAVTVPVPPAESLPGTLFMRIWRWVRWASLLAPALVLLAFELFGGRREVAARNAS